MTNGSAGGRGAIAYDQRLARTLVRPLVGTRVHPNALTALGLGLGLAAAACFAWSGTAGGAEHLAAGLYVLAIFMDHTDGELARLSGKTSRFGHYFDHVQAVSNYTFVWIGIGAGLMPRLGPEALWLGVLAGVSCAVIFGARFVVEETLGSAAVRQKVVAGFEPEDALYVVAPAVWLGGLDYLLMAAAVGAPLGAVAVALLAGRDIARWRRVSRGGER